MLLKNALIVNARKIERLVKERIDMLNALQKECVDECNKLPMGKLHAAKRGNSVAYYDRTRIGGKTGEYIPKSRINEAQKLAQREYDEHMIEIINRQLYHLSHLSNLEDEISVTGISEAKLRIVNKKIQSDEEYIMNWTKSDYLKKSTDNVMTEYYTAKGEHVRSKSECIIADTLYRMNVPYKYEYPCNVDGYIKYNPDFTCLNIRERREIIWEHFGMMDDESYSENVVRKIKMLTMSGLRFGEKFIFTMETSTEPLSSKVIERVITDYLL